MFWGFHFSRACSVQQLDQECWEQSLDYFTETALDSIEKFAGTLMYLTRWKDTLKNENIDVMTMIDGAILRVLDQYDEENGVLSIDSLKSIFNLTSAQVDINKPIW